MTVNFVEEYFLDSPIDQAVFNLRENFTNQGYSEEEKKICAAFSTNALLRTIAGGPTAYDNIINSR